MRTCSKKVTRKVCRGMLYMYVGVSACACCLCGGWIIYDVGCSNEKKGSCRVKKLSRENFKTFLLPRETSLKKIIIKQKKIKNT